MVIWSSRHFIPSCISYLLCKSVSSKFCIFNAVNITSLAMNGNILRARPCGAKVAAQRWVSRGPRLARRSRVAVVQRRGSARRVSSRCEARRAVNVDVTGRDCDCRGSPERRERGVRASERGGWPVRETRPRDANVFPIARRAVAKSVVVAIAAARRHGRVQRVQATRRSACWITGAAAGCEESAPGCGARRTYR